MTAIDFGAAVSRAWKYSTDAKRLLVAALFTIVSVAIFLSPVLVIYRSAASGTFNVFALLNLFFGVVVAFVVAGLIFLYALLLFTHNYAHRKSLSASAGFAKSRYLRFLAATIIAFLIIMLVSVVPAVGGLLAVIVYLAFFFYTQEIAVGNSGVSGSLSNSYNIVKRNKVNVIATAIIAFLLSVLITLVFALPLLAVFYSGFAYLDRGQILATFMSNLPLFAVTGVILAVGLALAILLAVGIETDVYMQLKKKRNK